MIPIYAHISIELSKAGLHAYCEETEDEVFIPNNGGRVDIAPLLQLLNDAETCNPDTVFSLTEKGKREARKLMNKL